MMPVLQNRNNPRKNLKLRWNKYTLLSLLIMLAVLWASFSNPSDGKGNDVSWIKKIVEGLDVGDYFLTTDNDGNLLITGCFINKSVFGYKALESIGNYDIFVVKYSSSGELLWVQQAGGRDFDTGKNISTDKLGNVFITGYFTGACFFDTYVVKSRAQ